MKYSIEINQLILSKTCLDVIDCAILNFIIFICSSKNQKIEKQRKNGLTWLNYKYLLQEMPLLKINSISALTPRIKKIESAGYIIIDRHENRRIYVGLTEKIDELFTNFNKITNDTEKYKTEENTVETNIDNKNTKYINPIFELYKMRINKDAKLTKQAKDKIYTRLKEYSPKELAMSIKKFSRNRWRMQYNSDKGMKWFFKSEEQIATFLAVKADIPSSEMKYHNE